MRSVLWTRTALLALLALAVMMEAGCLLGPLLPDPNQPGDEGNNGDTQNLAVNQPPVPDAGEDQVVSPGSEVVLRATATTDPDGDRLSFYWRQVGGTPSVVVEGGFGSVARFTVPSDIERTTALVFSLTVTDGKAAVRDQVVITVEP